MYVQRVSIENVKGFADKVEIDLARADGRFAGWTVIAGPNGAGKTTLLQLVALLSVGSTGAAELEPGYGDWLRAEASSGSASVRLSIGLGRHLDVGEFEEGRTATPGVRACGGLTVARIYDRRDGRVTDLQHLSYEVEHDPTTTPAPTFIAGFGVHRRASGVPAQPSPATERRHRLLSLFDPNATMASGPAWVSRLHARSKGDGDTSSRDLLAWVRRLMDDLLQPRGARVAHIDSDHVWVERGANKVPLSAESDGFQAMLGMLLEIVRMLHGARIDPQFTEVDGHVRVLAEGVILIDELDLHLHPGWQREAGRWFKSRMPNMQFLVTTHSPFVCQEADLLIALTLDSETGAPRAQRIADGPLFYSIVNGTADDAIVSTLFGLDRADRAGVDTIRDQIVALERQLIAGQLGEAGVRALDDALLKLPDDGSALYSRALERWRREHRGA